MVASDWQMIDGVATAWFDAPSLTEGATLAARVLEIAAEVAVDLRPTGVRVRLDPRDAASTAAISTAAGELGLVGDPRGLHELSVVIESTEPDAVRTFWSRALGYAPGPGGSLVDPLRRDPTLMLAQIEDRRPLRNRIHLDVVRPAATVEQADLGEASGPYGVRLADPDGNEVDLVPGDALGEDEATADWRAVFSGMACYRVASPDKQAALAAAAARLATDAGFPLLIDLRPGFVILDSGKDQWEADVHGLPVDFVALAAGIQRAAHELGATPDPDRLRFTQVFLDAADLAAVRGFWLTTLGYVEDPRPGLSDIVDPRRLSPELVFQELDPAETDRRRQRNRIRLELSVPSDQARDRLATALAAGGRLLNESEDRLWLADPEGNELLITSAS